MPERTSNVLAQLITELGGVPAVVWGNGPDTAWVDEDPAEQILAMLQIIQTRTGLGSAGTPGAAKPLFLVLNPALLAAATTSPASRAQLLEVASRGPSVDVHPVAVIEAVDLEEPQYLRGAEFGALVRVLGDLRVEVAHPGFLTGNKE